MTLPRNVFLIGPGYIGRNVIDQLLATGYAVTILVRHSDQALLFEATEARIVVGSLNDLDLLTAQTAQHEITINTASCDDLPSVQAILSGVRQRVNLGQSSIYIHTSGTGVLEDGALGMYKNDKIYRDDTPRDIDAISPNSMHRHVDIPVTQAAREFGDKAKIVIMLPPLIYGFDPVHKRHAFPLMAMVRFALKYGYAGYVGEGRNVWSVVHIKDLGAAYMTMLKYIDESLPSALLTNPYFFAENGTEISIREAAEHISQNLHGMGKMQTQKVQPWVEADYGDLFGPMTPAGLGCNSRSRAIRLRELGWETKEKDVWTSWKEDEIPSILSALDSTLA